MDDDNDNWSHLDNYIIRILAWQLRYVYRRDMPVEEMIDDNRLLLQTFSKEEWHIRERLP